MELDPKIEQELAKIHSELEKQGKLLPRAKLDECYNTFRESFGPEILHTLDGQDLLEKMHAHGNQDSLVYWLEFKDDEELPAVFGSIAGGSALKFGIYRSNETGEWVTGSPKTKKILSTDEAISYAVKHREQLIKGCEILEHLPDDADDNDYLKLQERLNEAAPDVSNLAWGHKYFHMLFPNKLDDFHSPQYQRFHLIKLLQEPPQAEGRYVAAGRYVTIALQFDMPPNHLTANPNHRDGRPHKYWRVGTRISDVFCWDSMREGNYVAVGWSSVGDLSHVTYKQESKEQIRKLMEQHYPKDPRIIGRQTQQLFNFVAAFNEGDIALASDGAKVLGIGRINGDYS
ncbi:AAA family ATPase, partial [bacterium]|nr:AAA family ATPase [bacterium]